MINKDEVRVSVIDIDPFIGDSHRGFTISWEGTIGFGEYTIYKGSDGKWRSDSEYMDTKDDHWFLDLLLKDIADRLIEEFR